MQIFQLSGGIENKFISSYTEKSSGFNVVSFFIMSIYLCKVFCVCSKLYVRNRNKVANLMNYNIYNDFHE